MKIYNIHKLTIKPSDKGIIIRVCRIIDFFNYEDSKKFLTFWSVDEYILD